MESSVDQETDEQTKLKSSSLSPKVVRPKLPAFSSSFRPSKNRSKTDPGNAGEISRAVLEDMKQRKHSRQRLSRSQPSKSSQAPTSTPTSPVTDSQRSGFSRRQNRSLKLTELTDKLKSGPSSNDISCNIPSSSDLSTVAPYGTLRKIPNVEDFSQCEQILDSPDDSLYESGSPKMPEDLSKMESGEALPYYSHKDTKDSMSEQCLSKLESSSVSSDCLPSPDDKSLDDDGTGTSESDTSSTTSGPYIYQPLNRDSEFFKLAKTAPQRRTGITTLATRNKVQAIFGTSHPMQLASFQQSDEDKRSEEHSGGHPPQRSESVHVPGSQRKADRYIKRSSKHKASPKEEGSIDSNGFGTLKSEETSESAPSDQSRDNLSLLAAGSCQSTDGQINTDDAVHFSEYTDENIVVEVSDNERFEKKNGKLTKPKSISDPSADKTKVLSEISKEINSSHAHSSPVLSRDITEDGGPLQQFQETNNPQLELSPYSEIVLPHASPKSSNPERRISQESQRCQSPGLESTIEEGDESEQYPDDSLLKPDKLIYIGSSAPTTPHNQSPTSTLERPPHNLLSVPITRKPILRSMSSASVLQHDRRMFNTANKDKDVVRKFSINSDDSIPGNMKPGTSVPEFASPLSDNGSYITISMPDVWKQNANVFDSSEKVQAYVKDKRYHVAQELYRNEQEYVEALRTLKEKYMIPLKTQKNLDENTVATIFHMVPEILTHHSIYLDFLNNVWENWDSKSSTLGDIIIYFFSKQTVLDSYLSFVDNYKKSGNALENDLLTKSSVSKFIEQCQRESGSKLSLKDLIARPIQRIPRYELLIQRLLENTPKDHPDSPLLMQAEKVMHEIALKIGSINDSQQEEGQHETLRKLEMLLITDLAAPDRTYLRHDMVQIMSKKDQCCIWMFSDLIIISSTKRKNGPVTKKVSIILQSPTGQDFAENIKHKICLRVGLDDIEVLKDPSSLSQRSTIEREQIEDDMHLLNQISDISSRLNCSKQNLDETIKEIASNLTKQLSDYQNRIHSADANKLELQITTQEKVFNLIVVFLTPEKRLSWETVFLDAKHKLSLLSDKRAPEFLLPLQITKTRAGMQFSCAASIDGVNANGYREVWVCNSDGYVGHMCLLSLQPEPIVTLNTPVPGCNARILCICAVPAYSGGRRSSMKNRRNRNADSSSNNMTSIDRPRINIESVDTCMESIGEDAGSPSESESSDDDVYSIPHHMETTEKLCVEDVESLSISTTSSSTSNIQEQNISGRWMHDALKSTMWLGTEDGCIHIFLCTDNIKTTKNKLKIQHVAPVYCIIYLDNKVFVSLANGDLIVYRRDIDGQWDTEHPYTRTLGSVTSPINKMHAVAGKLWCGSQNSICIVNPLTLKIEHQFNVNPDPSRCVQCIVSSGQGVWVAPQQSAKVNLYHATTYEFLHEINVTAAVTHKLQLADDIIRQHKTACLRVTALLICKDLLWVGTSAGVILTIPVPKITSTTTHSNINCPAVTGLVYGHTGHVRFLTSVELPNSSGQKTESVTSCTSFGSSNNQQQQQQQSYTSNTTITPTTNTTTTATVTSSSMSETPEEEPTSPVVEGNLSLQEIQRRSSMATTATMATRMLVISGGDGYEDFRNNVANEAAGRDDSTNHLLLWQV
ncbi:rho guanine nucleotide exchange factor 17-like [Octopus vulgaris]|uniref:Rho guanine nucleotide exchange factor 17-like n=2 Tax=Octopus vulgaris TaxID=6645 RepID=A0AA36BES2_OCTVU|nr:rho guanine nucleotide exchange factor 17-like [Octopus vulgaris]